jgi:Gram-negative bacterial TonB protein C-terminal
LLLAKHGAGLLVIARYGARGVRQSNEKECPVNYRRFPLILAFLFLASGLYAQESPPGSKPESDVPNEIENLQGMSACGDLEPPISDDPIDIKLREWAALVSQGCSGHVKLIFKEAPIYPREAVAKKLQGRVFVHILIDSSGYILDVVAAIADNPIFIGPSVTVWGGREVRG